MTENKTHILIVGGGTGGCAAALTAADLGYRVTLTEETDWLGGQLTSQAVPPDENQWIESLGCTRRYREFRDGVRRYYRDHFPLTTEACADPLLNPGMGRVSRVSHEPRVAVGVLDQMLAYHRATGRLRVMMRRKPVAASTSGDRVQAVTLRHLETGKEETIFADFILDATELGDVLSLGEVEYVSGAESKQQTGELHAPDGPAQPNNVQGLTWCFAMGFDPDCNDDRYRIEKPAQYERWRNYVPPVKPAWTGPLLSWTYPSPITGQPVNRVLFEDEVIDARQPLWPYRRICTGHHFASENRPHEVTLVNWPQNDYFEGNIIDCDAATAEQYLEDSRQLSLSLFYWMQNEAPRVDGGQGYSGLYLRPDILGTDDGFAKAAYIRESRRIIAATTVTENHIGVEAREGKAPDLFSDSVGIGHYRIDLHPSTGGDNYIDVASFPFQIPLGSLVPARVENLLPACKNLGVTHITNGCYRLHPVEWNIGEAAGALAAFCLTHGTLPRQVHENQTLLRDFQGFLEQQGVELAWPTEIMDEFAARQA